MTHLTHTQSTLVHHAAIEIATSAVLHGACNGGNAKARHEDDMLASLRAIAALLGCRVVDVEDAVEAPTETVKDAV